MKPILFCLFPCSKCAVIKNMVIDKDIKVITLSHNFADWSEEDKALVDKYKVLDELKVTAPVLVDDGIIIVGQLRIQRWLNRLK